ncbi:MAG: thiamine phosphate synthase, partial [Muribaculaceae bacterium]|nr:thiamine phosphate synthase [Muribaculaceae bacterium]
MQDLRVIAISLPFFIKNEAEKISRILSEEADIFHLRKPHSSLEEMERLLNEIPEEFYPRIKLHDNFSLLEKYPLGGVHLNSRCPEYHGVAGSVSCSAHSVEQLIGAKHYDYITLSPIFDSISKKGYKSAFDIETLRPILKERRVVALGGVTPEKFPLLR